MAHATEARGPHAFGFAWIDDAGRLRSFKQSGRITDCLGILGMARRARLLIGHCRYATHGSPADNENNHPHPADGGWYVHNGVIPAHGRLAHRYGLQLQTECDSELIGKLVETGRGTILARCREAARICSAGPYAMLGLWSRPDRLVVARAGNPLHRGEDETGTYFGSLRGGLPGSPIAVPDRTISVFSPRGNTHASF